MILFFLISINLHATSYSDSLKIARIDSLIEIGKDKIKQNNLNEGLKCFSIAETLLKDIKLEELNLDEKISISRCYHYRAYYCTGNDMLLKRSINDLKKRIEIIKGSPTKSLGGSYNLLANIYFKIGDYEMTENAYLKAINVYEKLNHKYNYIVKCNLAVLHLERKEFDKAWEVLDHNFPLIDDDYTKYLYLHTFGRVHKESGDFDSAVDFYKKSLMYTKDTLRIALVKNNLGVSLKRLERYEEALTELNESFHLKKKHYKEDYNVGYAYYFSNRGNIFQKQDQLDSALVYQNLAIIHCLEDSTWNAQDVFKNPTDKQLKLCEAKPNLLGYLETKARTAFLKYEVSNEKRFLDLALETHDVYGKLCGEQLKLCNIKPDSLYYLKAKAQTAFLNYEATNEQNFLDLALGTYDV